MRRSTITSGTSTDARSVTASSTMRRNSSSTCDCGRGVEALLDVGPQLLERVVLAHADGQVVVQRRQLLLLHGLHGHRVVHGAAAQVAALVGVVVGDREGGRPAGAHARQVLLELGHQPAAAQLHQVVAGGGAAHALAPDRAVEVDDQEVAGLGRPLHRRQPRRALAEGLELLVERVLGHLGLGPSDLEAPPLAQRRLRAHLDRGLEGQVALVGHPVQVELRVVDRHDTGLGHRLRVPLAQRALEHLLHDRVAADALHDDLGRRLAGPEPGHANVASQLPDRALHAPLHLVAGDRHVQADAVLLERRDLGGQRHRSRALIRAFQ